VTATRSRQPDDTIEATDQLGQLNLVDVARDAGVGRYVYISLSGQISSEDPLTHAKRTVEERVRASAMTYTILRPSYFMEVWLGPALGFDYPNGRATIYGSGENPISWISLADVAAFAIHSLENPVAENAVIELGGPDALSPREVVRIFEAISGRSFEIQTVPEEAIRAQQAEATDTLQQTFAALMLTYAAGDPIPMTETLRKYPLPLRTVRDYAQQVLNTATPTAQ
jgi:NADH dehydrogenase